MANIICVVVMLALVGMLVFCGYKVMTYQVKMIYEMEKINDR